MSDRAHIPGPILLAEGGHVPDDRACTRCDGDQHLVASGRGMGKYHCEWCELEVGFDVESDPIEFLLSRGLPGKYTKDLFGDRLLPAERRLNPVGD